MPVDGHKTGDVDVQRRFSSLQKSCPTEEMGPFPGNALGPDFSSSIN